MLRSKQLIIYTVVQDIKFLQLVLMGKFPFFNYNIKKNLILICIFKNSIGAGEASDILNTRTKGSKPILPEQSRFIEVSSNSITLHLPTWKDGGCRMSHFVVEYKKKLVK